jgi:hypothetical protein
VLFTPSVHGSTRGAVFYTITDRYLVNSWFASHEKWPLSGGLGSRDLSRHSRRGWNSSTGLPEE